MRVNCLIDLRVKIVQGFTIGIVCVLVASCGLMGWGEDLEEKSAEEAAEEAFGEGLDLSDPDSESDSEEEVELGIDLGEPAPDGSDLITGPSDPCPTSSRIYHLWYDHTCVIKMSTSGEEIYFAETSEIYPFALTMEADGNVSSKGENEMMLTMDGYIKTDSGSCPITNYSGTYPLRAEISGQCKNGKVNLKVKLQRVNFNIQGDCESAGVFEGPGLSSAPEIDHVFIHREIGDAYKLEIPPGGALAGMPGAVNCTYLFVLQPASLDEPEGLEIVPLVPPGD